MFRALTGVAAAVALVLAQAPAVPAGNQSAASARAKPKRKAAVKRKAAASAAKKSARAKTGKTAARRPVGQQRPTPERFREIEAVLHERGYLAEAPSGQWGPASQDALRRFQADQELPTTGRLDALSLIRLGLGPQRQP